MNENLGPLRPVASPWYPMPAAAPPARGGRGFAIAGFVMSALALVGVLAIGAWLALVGPGDSQGSTQPLTGQLSRFSAGSALVGTDLSAAVTTRIDEDGGDVTEMTCPRTPKVGQGVVTVCHGVISGAPYAVVVYFETPTGRFTLEPM